MKSSTDIMRDFNIDNIVNAISVAFASLWRTQFNSRTAGTKRDLGQIAPVTALMLCSSTVHDKVPRIAQFRTLVATSVSQIISTVSEMIISPKSATRWSCYRAQSTIRMRRPDSRSFITTFGVHDTAPALDLLIRSHEPRYRRFPLHRSTGMIAVWGALCASSSSLIA